MLNIQSSVNMADNCSIPRASTSNTENIHQEDGTVLASVSESVVKVDFAREVNLFYETRDESVKKPWTRARVLEVITIILEYKTASKTGSKRTFTHYNYGKKYDVIEVGGKNILVLKRKTHDDPLVQILPIDEYYDILTEFHKSTGHGGRDKMIFGLRKKYSIPRPIVEIFVKLCKFCNCKKSLPKKGIIVRPITSKDFNVRGQVDLIDLQSTPDRGFKWLMNYQDHSTKFLHLRPLKSKRAAEVAFELLKIFLEFGAPHILQSDNGREFTAAVIEELVGMWPDCKIVHGRPRNPSSQGSVERSNQDVENMLRGWLNDNNSTNWSVGCYFIQWQKNSSFHRVIGRTPYRALFGCDPKVGLKSTSLPNDLINNIATEEELEELANLEGNEEQEKLELEMTHAIQNTENVEELCNLEGNETQEGLELYTNANAENTTGCACSKNDGDDLCFLCNQEKQIHKERQDAYEGQRKAAEKMVESSRTKFKTIEIGSSVVVAIPKVDRGPLDVQTVLGKVMDYNNGVYKIGTSSGIIKNWFPRNEIRPSGATASETIPEKTISLRQAVSSQSKFGGQGYTKCSCRPAKKQCDTKKCVCKKSGLICNSRCHNSSGCINK